MIEVVPPQAAARVPVSKVSDALVPPNGSSMWVCASMPPWMTYFPVASITVSTEDAARREDRGDRLPVDQDVGLAAPRRGDDGAARDECGSHGSDGPVGSGGG